MILMSRLLSKQAPTYDGRQFHPNLPFRLSEAEIRKPLFLLGSLALSATIPDSHLLFARFTLYQTPCKSSACRRCDGSRVNWDKSLQS